MKTKLAFAAFLSLFAILPFAALADASTTTFPKDGAGMAAYIKLKPLNQANFDNACQSLFDDPAPSGQTYMIGTKNYPAADNSSYSVEFHIYLGADGWLVVYLLKDQEPSRIVNWQSDQPLSNTLLKIAIEDAINKIGAQVADNETMEYYDFSYPDAAKMTLIRENLGASMYDNVNDFSILIPGTLYQASYSTYCRPHGNSFGVNEYLATLYVDNNFAGGKTGEIIAYGNYDKTIFEGGQSHTVTLNKRFGSLDSASAVTLLLYKPI